MKSAYVEQNEWTSVRSWPQAAEEPELAAGEVPTEPCGSGANLYTYFVCSTIGGAFTRLPDVTPGQGLTLVHSSAQLEPLLTQNTPCTPPETPQYPLTPPKHPQNNP
jgi:hypothetical protein